MAFELSGMTSMLISWFVNPLIWLIIIGVIIFVTFGFLKIRQRKKLKYPTLEVVDLGNGKMGFYLIKSGFFGRNKFLGGLWDYGEEVLKSDDGSTILDFSTEDFQEVNGKRGVVCYRDPIRQKILVPINNLVVRNKELVAAIAPSSYTDTGIDIIKEAEKETRDWKDKMLQFIAFALVIVFALVSIIVIVQMVKQGQTAASDLIVKAGTVCSDNCKSVCSQIAAAASSGAK